MKQIYWLTMATLLLCGGVYACGEDSTSPDNNTGASGTAGSNSAGAGGSGDSGAAGTSNAGTGGSEAAGSGGSNAGNGGSDAGGSDAGGSDAGGSDAGGSAGAGGGEAGSAGAPATCGGLPAQAAMTDDDNDGIKIARLTFDDSSDPPACAVSSGNTPPSLVEFWNDDVAGLRAEFKGAGAVLQASHGIPDNSTPSLESLPVNTDITVRFEDIGGGQATGYYDLAFVFKDANTVEVKTVTFTSTLP